MICCISIHSSLEELPNHGNSLELWVWSCCNGTCHHLLLQASRPVCTPWEGTGVCSVLASSGCDGCILCSPQTWYALVYAVFITSAFCYLLITWANLHLPSTIVTAFWPVQVCTYSTHVTDVHCHVACLFMWDIITLCVCARGESISVVLMSAQILSVLEM